MTLHPRTRLDLGVAAAVILIGLVFAVEAWRIDPRSYEAVGPRFVPVLLAATMIGLGLLVALGAMLRNPSAQPLREEGDLGFEGSDLKRVMAVIGAGAAYTFCFWAFGYMAATALGMLLALLAFGVRSPLALILLPIFAAIAYQALFMGLMGLLDPRGALLDLRWLSEPVTPQ
ncbi:tripartite tricarboxylate transporter TctB family protein [Jannaschia aquimarina]|uniref:Tripartite tricarboxylate transporter TctB family protein n=1 Tax=Jannaschia aquimarina TaxID=935700 RepID=A0A0D1EHC3_9RHOB|nr:tripartite tricarboxylate transporter TctB family protein [Jannaschia aquimarina]KIT16261.1 Tripartite tricarboxylate transporter TctB family protein [Jannaschia aquimarina]SNT15048.1 Tripartite tricarboxylate transporter TctB family protein [Jannaschia aquimarina]